MEQDKPQIATDPNLAAEQAQAQQVQVAALQTQAQGDTASLMARYGTTLALAGAAIPGVSPAAAPGLSPSLSPAFSSPSGSR
jgi:hypothetical protein